MAAALVLNQFTVGVIVVSTTGVPSFRRALLRDLLHGARGDIRQSDHLDGAGDATLVPRMPLGTGRPRRQAARGLPIEQRGPGREATRQDYGAAMGGNFAAPYSDQSTATFHLWPIG